MPKYAYKPSSSLSKHTKRRREIKKSLLKATNVTNSSIAFEHNILEVDSTSLSQQNPNIIVNKNLYERVEPVEFINCSVLQESENNSNKIDLDRCVSGKQSFQSKLASLVISSRLARNNATELLKLLKSVDNLDCLKSLPMDSRTLLSTPRSNNINIISIGGGQYIHFGIVHGLTNLYKTEPNVNQLSVIELWFNIDGLPIDNRGSSFWPILCGVCINDSIKPFIVGSYFGIKKPSSVNEYLSEFVEELNEILTNGLQIDDLILNVCIKGIIADAPARAFVKQVKGHSGYFGCEKCEEEGEYLSGSLSFPGYRAQLRTDESFTNRSNEEHHIGTSPLLRIIGLGLISFIPLDYMHLCCLGIMKKILQFILKGTRVEDACNNIKLSKDQVISINQKMKIIKKWICSDFARIPNDLNNLNTFKATEFRQIMLYTGPYLFKDIVSIPVYNNFLIFHVIMRILSCKTTVYTQNEYADSLSKHFVKTFCLIYGRGNVSYNVHSLIHLSQDAKKYGVLDNFSSFPYENYLQHIKKIVQPGRFPLTQLYNRITEERACESFIFKSLANYPILDGYHFNGPLPEDISCDSVSQYSIVFMKTFTIRIENIKRRSNKRDDCIIMASNKVGLVKNVINRNGDIFIVCSIFEKVVPIYNYPCSSMFVGMYECSKLSSTLKLYHVNSIKFKACYFPTTNIIPHSTFNVCTLLHTNC